MTTYTTLPQDDSNLDVTLTESTDLVTLNIQPASLQGGGGGGAVDSVNGQTGVVVLSTTDIDEGSNLYYTTARFDTDFGLKTTSDLTEGTNLYYTDARVDNHLTGGVGVTYLAGDISIGQPVGVADDVTFGSVTGDMFGVQHFTAKARETITAGQPVYISGHSGNTPEVMVADYADPLKMPAFGIASADINNNNNGAISTYGDLKNVDTTGTTEGETWAVGDSLYVNGSKLTNVRPSLPSQQIQKVAKVIRVQANTGQMFLLGAGRANDTPNLAHYNVFIGNAGGVERRQLTYTDILNTPDLSAYITASSTDTLTNKGGSNSQWTNDAGYITSSALTPYYTSAQVDALPVSTFSNDAGYLTTETDSQTLSFTSPNLTISNGNTVDLSALTPAVPVDSVNGQTGAVVLELSDIDDVTISSIEAGDAVIWNGAGFVNGHPKVSSDGGNLDLFSDGSSRVVFNTVFDSPDDIYNSEMRIQSYTDTAFDIAQHMAFRTSNDHPFLQVQAQNTGGVDDGDHSVEMSLQGLGATITNTDDDLIVDASDNLRLKATTKVQIQDAYYLPNTDGSANQVIATDGLGNLTFVDQSGGGGGGTLAGLSDVDILNLQNNDLLMYNSTAGEWQNTNLGLTVTPTLSGDATGFNGLQYTVTVTNHATYDQPAYFCEVYDGSTLVVTNSNVTDNGDGTLTFTIPATEATYQIRVKAQDFGDLQSEVATLDFDGEAFGGTFRYWRITGVTCSHGNWWMLANLRFYTGGGQTGTAYPANMTSATAPTPYVVSESNIYNASYPGWKSMDSNTTNTFYWTLGSTNGPADWVTIDLGSSINISSLTITSGNGVAYAPTGFTILASDTGAFAGEETTITTQTGLPSVAAQVTNVG